MQPNPNTIADLDAAPCCPEGWTVIEHKPGGKLDLATTKLGLYLVSTQQGEGTVGGEQLRAEFADKPVLNATLLCFLLQNQHLIPEAWKENYVFFWGTIYRHVDGYECVRY